MSCWSPIFILLAAAAFILILGTEGAEAKRGCANFGHSCYGGMGKRGEPVNQNEELLQDIQQEDNPEFVFTAPRNEFRIQQEERPTLQELYQFSPFIRQWLRSYRNALEFNEHNERK